MRRLFRVVIAVLGISLVGVSSAGAAARLTPAERARVLALVQGGIRATLDGVGVRVENVLPWSADGTRETLIGGGVTLAFDSLQDVEADWALMDFPDNSAEYTITTVHYRVEDADAVDAWVDLRKNEVVSFDVRDGTVDQSTIRQVAQSPRAEELREDEGGGGSHGALMAGLVIGSVLASGIALGRRYGPAGD
jgi:hypothetical protein